MSKNANIILTKDECYCELDELYDNIAEKFGYQSRDLHYDCTKISVTKPVLDQVFSYYKERRGADEGSIAMMWVCLGPKADLPGDGWEARIEEGFIL